MLRAPRRRLLITFAALLGAALALPSSAAALDDCQRRSPISAPLVSGRGQLESVIADDRGHLFFTDADAGELLRMDRRSSEPRVLASGIRAPGGLAFLPDGSLLVGYGDSAATARSDPPQAGLLRVDPSTGEQQPYASRPDDVQRRRPRPGRRRLRVERPRPGGRPGSGRRRHADLGAVPSSNGLVVDTHRTGSTSPRPSSRRRSPGSSSPIPRTSRPGTRRPRPTPRSLLDGLTRDAHDRLYAAANLGGQVWRVQEGGPGCVLTHLPPLGPSAVAFGSAEGEGRPRGFGRRNLYVVTFQGDLIQLKNVRGQNR